MKAAHYKVNIVPVIAKADTLTKQEVQKLKNKVGVVIVTSIKSTGNSIGGLPPYKNTYLVVFSKTALHSS